MSGGNKNQRPLPGVEHYILGIDQKLIPSVLLGVDYLVIPPPPTSEGMREVTTRDMGGSVATLANNSAGTISDIDLIYKNSVGAEIILASDNPVLSTHFSNLLLDAPFFLSSEDQGIFIRVGSSTDVVEEGEVTAYGGWSDVRGVERRVVEVGPEPISLFPDIPVGEAVRLITNPGATTSASIYLLNYDTSNHGGNNFSMTLSHDGLTIPFGEDAQYTSAGRSSVLLRSDSTNPNIGHGSALSATDKSAIGDAPAQVMVAFVRSNQAPMRHYEGGAY